MKVPDQKCAIRAKLENQARSVSWLFVPDWWMNRLDLIGYLTLCWLNQWKNLLNIKSEQKSSKLRHAQSEVHLSYYNESKQIPFKCLNQ